MKTGNAIVATFFLVMAHLIAIVCFFAVPLLIHYGVDPSTLPLDPGSVAIPFWFIYMFIGILFMISGMEMQQKVRFRTKIPVQSQQKLPLTKNEKLPPAITHKIIQPKTNEMSILKKEITPVVIKQRVMPKKDVSDIQKHVDELLSSVELKSSYDAKKEEVSILKKEIIHDIIIPQSIPAVDERFESKIIEQPPAQQHDTIINNVDIEIDKLRNEIAERRKKQEELTKEVDSIEP